MTRKWIMRALCILCLAAMLTGCGREPEVTETTIEVKKNGQVVHTIIEDFSESYYNLDELESTIQQACDTYNASAGKEAVVLKAAEENDDHTVTVAVSYTHLTVKGARPQGDGGRAVRRNRNFGRKNSGRSQNHRRSY